MDNIGNAHTEMQVVDAANAATAKLPGRDAAGYAHHYADIRYRAACRIAQLRSPGLATFDAIEAAHPDLAPGLSGLPFTTAAGLEVL